MKRWMSRPPFRAFFAPSGSSLLTVAAAMSLLRQVEGPDYQALALTTVVISVLAGRRTSELRHAQYIFVALVAAGVLVSLFSGGLTSWVNVLIIQFGTVLGPWWVGSWWRQRAELVQAGWERAARLQREKDMAAEQARLRERARIAQDMHDSLGHELSLMALVAGGLELSPDLGESHRATAARLRAGAVAATERLHEIIGLLGERPEESSAGTADDDIAGLVERARKSGVRVELERRGALEDAGAGATWSATTRHAARRVVQESLTNAVKHAPGGDIAVLVERTADEAVITVTNGPPRPPEEGAAPVAPVSGSGTGLISLDERIRLAGGSLRAGPREEGFEVVARLPRVPPPARPERERAPSAEPGPPEELRSARKRARRHLLRASTLPVGMIVALVGVLLVLYVLTVEATSLEPADYERMRLGQPRGELAAMLTDGVDRPSPLLLEPPIPEGADCEYYRANDNIFDLSDTMYRLCFDERGQLASKDTLHRK
ncbi:sensor histidine kinase [Streptomyces sp. PT12]|uniref:sensor histidine kinase n=1 Tax=Streptomyces sp. PT12 TaxID=1510197 RepID=UPI000DE505A0|nr:histidine kinase [Streptomyces sp. PT12]RBM22105.1 two-component sensor histidine kinase [Streptomyces sp. PT12]